MTVVPGSSAPPTGPDGGADGGTMLPAKLVRRVISGLPTGLIVLDASDRVVLVNTVARRMGVVDSDELAVAELAELVRATRGRAAPGSARSTCPRYPSRR